MYVCRGGGQRQCNPFWEPSLETGTRTMAVMSSEHKAGVAADAHSARDRFCSSSFQNFGITVNSPTPRTHGLALSGYR